MIDWTVEQGDCLEVLRTLPDACVDSIVTDPPAGISFMGKTWDEDKGGPQEWIAWLTSVMSECLRVLKPGGHALVWALPRTSHWTGMACELAGFEVRDRVVHLFGSGFPKSLNVSKAIDAAAGAERPVVGSRKQRSNNVTNSTAPMNASAGEVEIITVPATPEAQQWDGWGTALKPAAEDWWLLRKPLAGTVARNVLEHGTGALNVDGCRVEGVPRTTHADGNRRTVPSTEHVGAFGMKPHDATEPPAGRWPANVVLSCDCCAEHYGGKHMSDCPVALLDAQSGNRPGMSGGGKHRPDAIPGMFGAIDCTHTARADQGGASRFFYTAKTSTKEREAGLEHLPKRGAAELTGSQEGAARLDSPRTGAGRTSKGRANHHPTVKPLALMRWLVRLITPPGGIVLDPFTGSGSTGCAAVLEGHDFIGIEQQEDYVQIAKARITHWEAA